jgi:hypothetical protein
MYQFMHLGANYVPILQHIWVRCDVLLQCTIKYNLSVNLQQICFVPSNVLDIEQNGQVQKRDRFFFTVDCEAKSHGKFY